MKRRGRYQQLQVLALYPQGQKRPNRKSSPLPKRVGYRLQSVFLVPKFLELLPGLHVKILANLTSESSTEALNRGWVMAKVSELLGSRTDIYSLREDMTAYEAARY